MAEEGPCCGFKKKTVVMSCMGKLIKLIYTLTMLQFGGLSVNEDRNLMRNAFKLLILFKIMVVIFLTCVCLALCCMALVLWTIVVTAYTTVEPLDKNVTLTNGTNVTLHDCTYNSSEPLEQVRVWMIL